MSESITLDVDCIRRQVAKMIDDRRLAVDELTRDQLASAIEQMIKSGDFKRYVRVDNAAQCVVYIPNERAEKLETDLNRSKTLLAMAMSALNDIATFKENRPALFKRMALAQLEFIAAMGESKEWK